VPPGFTDPVVPAAGGNPYGTSFVTGPNGDGPDASALDAARYQGRLAETTIRLLAGSHTTDVDGNAHPTEAAQPPQTV
jgi:NAD(P)H dehydrogenase (quinone)